MFCPCPPFLQECQNRGRDALLCPTGFSCRVFCGSFSAFLHYYPDEITRQHFTCHGHHYGRVCSWFVEKLVDLNHACWCLSVLWTTIPESKVRTVSCSSNKMNQPQSPKRKKERNFFLASCLTQKWVLQKNRKRKIFFPHFGCFHKNIAYYSFKTPNAKIIILRILGFGW